MLQLMIAVWKNRVLMDRSLRIVTDKARLSRHFSNWIIGLQLTCTVILYSCDILAVDTNNILKNERITTGTCLEDEATLKVNKFLICVVLTILQYFHLTLCSATKFLLSITLVSSVICDI